MSIGKSDLRIQARARRVSLTPAQRAASATALLQALAPWTGARVAAYASTGDEPGTQPLLDAFDDVLLPVLLEDGDLDWAVHDGELVGGLRGTRQPSGPRLGPEAVSGCDVVVVPALGVDRAGTRLGRGGGSYDRALRRSVGLTVAALHDGELHERLPAEPHDVPVDAAVLPSLGLVRL